MTLASLCQFDTKLASAPYIFRSNSFYQEKFVQSTELLVQLLRGALQSSWRQNGGKIKKKEAKPFEGHIGQAS